MSDLENTPRHEYDEDSSTDTVLDEPKLYKVLMHNDHFTTMDFVVEILMQVFHKKEPEALQIMMNIHKQGMGMCGIYTYDIAHTKATEVHRRARERGFPLRCTCDEE